MAYQSGVANYHAGKLQTAKADFDRAVDLMLTSNFDLRNEPQLRDEFDRVIDAVNTLEMEALKQGNGFAPKIEPAPVDIANDVTFPVDPNGQGAGNRRTQDHPVRSAAGDQRSCRRLHQLFLFAGAGER